MDRYGDRSEIHIGLNYKVREYIPQPLRCFKCQRMGHTAQLSDVLHGSMLDLLQMSQMCRILMCVTVFFLVPVSFMHDEDVGTELRR